jgi:hypothetical protein
MVPKLPPSPWSFVSVLLILVCFGSASFSPAQEKYPTKISTARSTWLRDSKRISELLEKLRDQATVCNRLDKEIAGSQEEIRRVEEELAEQLREMAEGRFCSECLRSATQLEREGEPFTYHVRKVKGTAIPASPEQFAQARQRAAEKIASIRKRLDQHLDEQKTSRDALSNALHELNVTVAAYHRDIMAERDVQIASWAYEASVWEKKLQELQAEMDVLAKQPETSARDIRLRAVDAQFRSSLTSTSSAELRARQTATSFNQSVRKDMDYLAKRAEAIPSGQPLVDGWQIARSITSQNITYGAGPVRRPQSPNAAQILKGGSMPAPARGPAAVPEKSVSDLLRGS